MRDRIVTAVDTADKAGGSVGLVVVAVALWATAGYLAHRPNATTDMDRFCAGFFLTAYPMAAGTILKNLWLWFRNGRTLGRVKISICDLMTWGFAGFLICIAGGVSWYVGWNGKTSTYYGLGVFVSAALYDWSIGRYLKKGRQATKP
ncbi:hypothetical protein [Paraburkholderia fungorum]|jgi:hypothetical protein|uniref:Uncharacterized protein n=2 Tax=Bacteria TaxID=2 RepID=A0AAP5UTK2_9BURK|nr:hypothetical protein [Paraburkholderia fungorum]MBB5542138.1 hypothetical protein [Paraburkholderia fungorum]MDT8836502.1 hypothetical protein [Paraburkholderia fungorum]